MNIASIQNNYMHIPLVSRNNTDNNFEQNSENKENTNMKNIQIQEEETQKERQLTKDEARMLLVQYQATQVMKNQIDTYFDVEEDENDELNFSDVRDINKMFNRNELLKNYDEDRVRTQQQENKLELWA